MRLPSLLGRRAPLLVVGAAVLTIVATLVWVNVASRPIAFSPARPARTVGGSTAPSTVPTVPGVPTQSATSQGVPAPTPGAANAWARVPVEHVDTGWVDQTAARTGIPARALTAYADAQLAADAVQPGCHMPWTMLAGIGLVESGHGSNGGARLQADGATTIRILGPALDGTHGNKAVPATADGLRLDGDIRWDHAVGPMQFLPSTWVRWAVSDDHSVPDPNDIDDAALTAARYLCQAGGDLATAAGWRAAIAAYNAPTSYAEKVVSAATAYARATLS